MSSWAGNTPADFMRSGNLKLPFGCKCCCGLLDEIFCLNSGPSESSPPVGHDLVPKLTAALFKATVTHGDCSTLNWPLTSLNPSLGSRERLNSLLVSVFIHLTLLGRQIKAVQILIPKNKGSI